MKKLVLLAHTCLDGFVAGSKGELDDFDAGEENLQFVYSPLVVVLWATRVRTSHSL